MQLIFGRDRIRNGTSRDFYLKAAKAAKAAKAKTDGARGAWVLLDAAKPVQVNGNAVGCGGMQSGVVGDWWLRSDIF